MNISPTTNSTNNSCLNANNCHDYYFVESKNLAFIFCKKCGDVKHINSSKPVNTVNTSCNNQQNTLNHSEIKNPINNQPGTLLGYYHTNYTSINTTGSDQNSKPQFFPNSNVDAIKGISSGIFDNKNPLLNPNNNTNNNDKQKPSIFDKPIILFYNYNEGEVGVDLKLDSNIWELSYLYPGKIIDKNNFFMKFFISKNRNFSNNILTDCVTNKEYSYVFWEADSVSSGTYFFRNYFATTNNLYLFKSEIVCDKLDTLLKIKGLNVTEREDFITYWMSDLLSKEYVVLSFMSSSELEEMAKLSIDPKPDILLRVFMIFKSLNQEEYENFSKLYTFISDIDTDTGINQGFNRDCISTDTKLVVEWGAKKIED